MNIAGSLLLREHYTAPWGVQIPDSRELASLAGASTTDRVVAFHLVEAGEVEVHQPGSAPLLLSAGEMVVSFGGRPHSLRLGQAATLVPVGELLARGNRVFAHNPPRAARTTGLMCGVFVLRDVALNPLLAALPPMLHCVPNGTQDLHRLSAIARLMAGEIDRAGPGSDYMIARLLEVLCAEAIRVHLAQTRATEPGWIAGLRDPVVAKAIALIQQHPSEPWTVKRIAQRVAMSPSRFATRFRLALGESPMRYLTKWRMHLSCRALANPATSLADVASMVGYRSGPAFQRAFKRHVGTSPGSWRSANTA